MVVSVIANLSLSGEYRGRLTFTSTANVAPAKAGAACSMVLGRRRPQLSLGRRKSNRLAGLRPVGEEARSEEHTSEIQSLMRISYAAFCLKKKKTSKQLN